jgi:GntR family transcriptional regulator/MocR family aminotransferase
VDWDESSWLTLSPRPGETLRRALERALREAITVGLLREGTRLPSSRAMARALKVSRGVVTDAYAQLEAQGFLTIAPRLAPVVAAFVAAPARVPRQRPPTPRQPRYDLTPTTRDVTLFPLREWLRASAKVGRTLRYETLDYRPPRGEPCLREALAAHLGQARGVIADPEQILVVQGTAQGIDLLLRVLADRGAARIAVEDPSHTTQHARIQALGLELVAQPVDEEGLVVDGLEADAALVTPAHQFPTGAVLSGRRRRALLAWAQRSGALIVEDDYDAEFRYDHEPVRALQGLAAANVVHLGTVSKTLAPALRLGWVVAPDGLLDELEQAKRLADDFSPALDQLAFAELLSRGAYVRHLRRARAVYRKRRDRLVGALKRELPDLDIEGIAAGMHMVLRLPAGCDDAAVARSASEARVRVPPLSSFRIRPAAPGGLVLGYGRLHEASVGPAVRALARVIRPRLSSSCARSPVAPAGHPACGD